MFAFKGYPKGLSQHRTPDCDLPPPAGDVEQTLSHLRRSRAIGCVPCDPAPMPMLTTALARREPIAAIPYSGEALPAAALESVTAEDKEAIRETGVAQTKSVARE